MTRDPVSDDLMVRYLLGDVSDEERSQLEERYFVDEDVLEQLTALEDELIDGYVRGDLSETQRRQFDHHFLNSEARRRKLAFAQSLFRYLSAMPEAAPAPKQEMWWQKITPWRGVLAFRVAWSLAAASATLLIVGVWVVRDNWRLRVQLRQMQAEQTQLKQRNEELNRHLAQLKGPAIGSVPATLLGEEPGKRSQPLPIVALALTPGLLRGSAEQRLLIIPHGAHLVRLQVDLGSNQSYESYLATLETVEGARVWSKEGLRPVGEGGRTVVLELPSSLLGNRDYILKLRGRRSNADLAGYSFRVVKH